MSLGNRLCILLHHLQNVGDLRMAPGHGLGPARAERVAGLLDGRIDVLQARISEWPMI